VFRGVLGCALLCLSFAVSNAHASALSHADASTRTEGCFSHLLACGYPNPHTTGVTDCAALPNWSPSDLPAADYYYSGSGDVIDIYVDNVTIQGYDISGWQFEISGASGTTFNDDCVSTDGQNGTLNAIYVTSNGSTEGSHTTVENSTVVGAGCPTLTSKNSLCMTPGVDQQLAAGGADSMFSNDIFVGAVEPVGLSGGSTLVNSYVDANGYEQGAHTEDSYSSPGASNMTINHNTLLNPSYETANIFIDNGSSPCSSTGNAITGNFMAGGGYTIYGCSGETSMGGSTMAFTGNDLARCDGSPQTHDYPGLGGTTCFATPPSSNTHNSAFGAGNDTNGYWPAGGYFGTFAYMYCGNFSGNTWDDNGSAVSCNG
jgi:hypothetical protein